MPNLAGLPLKIAHYIRYSRRAQSMNNGGSFNLNRVIRAVVLAFPPTFFVLLHLPIGPRSGLPPQPSVGRATSTLSPVGYLSRVLPPP